MITALICTITGVFLTGAFGMFGWFAKRHFDVQDKVLDEMGRHEVRISVLESWRNDPGWWLGERKS